MPDTKPQSAANHARFDPAFHFFMAPVLIIGFVVTVVHLFREPTLHSAFVMIFAAALVVAGFQTRINALKVQDRVIRLEERLRMQAILPEPLRSRIPELTERQLIALRFASDGELAGLVQQTLAGNMKPADIKKAIQVWRPDNFRV